MTRLRLFLFDPEIDPTPVNILNDKFLIVIISPVQPLNDIDAFFFIFFLKGGLILYNHVSIAAVSVQNVIRDDLLTAGLRQDEFHAVSVQADVLFRGVKIIDPSKSQLLPVILRLYVTAPRAEPGR